MSALIPPDRERCQSYKPNGESAWTLGGGHRMVQCKNRPVFIATENEPGEDGAIGSMSLCQECLVVFHKQMGVDYATLTPINTENV